MDKLLKLSLIILVSFVFIACNSSDKIKFNPTLTVKYKLDNYIKSLKCYDDVCIVGASSFSYSSRGEATLLSLQTDGTATTLSNLYADNNQSGFGYRVAIGKEYALVASKTGGDIYLYTYHSDTGANLMQKISTPLENTDGLAFYDNFFIISNSKGALLYYIDENGTVTLKATISPQNNDTSLGFGFTVDISKDYLVIGQRSGVLALVYSYESDGTTKYIESLHPSIAKDNDNSFAISLYNDKLLVGLNGASLYQLSKDGNATETIIKPMDGASNDYVGRAVALSDKFLAVEDQGGDSIYTIDGDKIEPFYRIDDTKYAAYNLSISGASFTPQGYTKIHYLDGEFYSYDFFPYSQIYNYNYPSSSIELPENESPCSLFSVDAFSNDGNLTYRLAGDDSAWFDMDGATLKNNTAFDYENPLDSDGDNLYQLTIIMEDPANHSLELPITVAIENHDYVYQHTYSFTSDYFQLKNSYQNDLLASSVSSDYQTSIDVLHFDGQTLLKTATVTSPRSDDYGFGNTAAINTQKLLVSSQDRDVEIGDGAGVVFYYRKENNGTFSFQKQLVGDDSEDNAGFGNSIYMDDETIAIGAEHKYAFSRDNDRNIVYRSGAVYVYANDENLTRVQKIKPNTGIYDAFGSQVVFNDWLMAISATRLKMVYLYTKNEDGTWQSLAELTHQGGEDFNLYGESLAINDKYLIITGYPKTEIYRLNKIDQNIEYMASIDNLNVADNPTISLDGDELFVASLSNVIHYRLSYDDKSITNIETIKSLIIQPNRLYTNFIATQNSLFQMVTDGKSLVYFKKEE